MTFARHVFSPEPSAMQLVYGDNDTAGFLNLLSSFQALVLKSALFISMHIFLFIFTLSRGEKGQEQQPRQRGFSWTAKEQHNFGQKNAPAEAMPGADILKHGRKDSLFS
ncbi:uncharacterized protein K452DRAFT_292247 [Aplosporella prunicola CBS 121167]|uniref:Uncharacterized protein n=1 Tax=Aplosporella prunicola CBS 121167 TaxID=1176127 RepID=A0A6A6AYG9_9PEZI|nr:uncharacterized protein K452DRAFT_292247 [Aplosporella prunicola CBS 121167]KAF2136656.1 hypothetical protein K452DRAFT_292247 [Aplosporella prunicola CBS 121167]